MSNREVLECGHLESPHSSITRGWGMDDKGNRYCYACCAERDKEQMRQDGKITLYLVKRDHGHFVTNWPGSLEIAAMYVAKGNHNLAGARYDVYFQFDGFIWHGVQYGDNTQLCHCRRTKERVK